MSSQTTWYLRFQKLPLVILTSVLISGMVAGLRGVGLLEKIELWTYDRWVEMRGQVEDSRILLVAIDDSTLQKLNSDKVSDQDLTQTLKNLEQYNPRVIGVDILRDVPIGEGRDNLINYLNSVYAPSEGKVKPIILTCQLPSPEKPQGILPPQVPDPNSAIGFANIEVDPDQVIRRVSISSIPAPNAPKGDVDIMTSTPESKGCLVPFSLGFLVSLGYLQEENITIKQTVDDLFKLGDVVFTPPSRRAGGYQNLDPSNYQIILDYRLKKSIETVSLWDVLQGNIQRDQIRDRVVLIGYTTNDDIHLTPFGMIPGVMVHAQVINQILSNVLDNRSPLWYFPEPVEWVWIILWGVAGGVIASKCRPGWLFSAAEAGAGVSVYGITFVLFLQQGWVPVVPPILALVASAIAVRSISQLKPTDSQGNRQEIPPQPRPVFNVPSSEIGPTVVEGSYPIKPPETPPPIGNTVVEPTPYSLKYPQQPIPPEEPVEPVSPSHGSSRPAFKRVTDSYTGECIGEGERYRLERRLGKGGMGEVYLACDTKLRDRLVAIKIMTSYAADNDHLIQRFNREVESMATFSSMNIVKINDFGLTAPGSIFRGSPFYVMEYLQGTSLNDYLKSVQRLSVTEAMPIIYQICDGLREAHSLNIVHRDLKPDNIYLIPHPTLGQIVKILDFGIAKIIRDEDEDQSGHTLTAMGAFIGTSRYASPEQCLGEKLDHRTDIYSLGVMLYEMLSGTNPYNIKGEQNTQGYWITSHISKAPQPLRTQPGCGDISPQLEAVVMKCLEKAPEKRFASIQELEEALRVAVAQGFGNYS